nr:NADH-plastoquinone oxidoreductase subunit 6 [Keteleeria evelyniana var. pendula]
MRFLCINGTNPHIVYWYIQTIKYLCFSLLLCIICFSLLLCIICFSLLLCMNRIVSNLFHH